MVEGDVTTGRLAAGVDAEAEVHHGEVMTLTEVILTLFLYSFPFSS